MAYDLITKAEYKTYAGISSTNSDREIDFLIPKVSDFVKTYCRRRFVEWVDDAKSEVFSGDFPSFILAETPVIAVSAVEYSQDYGQTWTAYTEFTHWVLDGDQVLPIGYARWPKAIRGYRVTYTAGYETIPGDLKLAVADLITYYIKNDSAIHSAKAPGTNAVQIEYVSTTSLPANIRRVLDQYVLDYS
jgi:hypothetical protein